MKKSLNVCGEKFFFIGFLYGKLYNKVAQAIRTTLIPNA